MSNVAPVTENLSHSIDSAQSSLAVIVGGRLSDYRQMARPRIMVMSAAAVLSGFVLASPIVMSWPVLGIAIVGVCCLVAASSVLNQVMESKTDRMMNRTVDRPVASGRISRLEGAAFGILASLTGATLLWIFVNATTSITAFSTMLCYVLLYTPLKRISTLCTTVGAVPGAMPPVLGWLAAGGEFGLEALALFAVFFVWQFPFSPKQSLLFDYWMILIIHKHPMSHQLITAIQTTTKVACVFCHHYQALPPSGAILFHQRQAGCFQQPALFFLQYNQTAFCCS